MKEDVRGFDISMDNSMLYACLIGISHGPDQWLDFKLCEWLVLNLATFNQFVEIASRALLHDDKHIQYADYDLIDFYDVRVYFSLKLLQDLYLCIQHLLRNLLVVHDLEIYLVNTFAHADIGLFP
jgi:hypothetical protein